MYNYNVFVKNGQGGASSGYYHRHSCASLREALRIAQAIVKNRDDSGWESRVYIYHSKAKYIYKRTLLGEYIPTGKEILVPGN